MLTIAALLGVILGFLLCLVVVAVSFRFSSDIQREAQSLYAKALDSPQGYIVGLSDDEQAFADSLPKDRDYKLE
jgi:hypothetical protein